LRGWGLLAGDTDKSGAAETLGGRVASAITPLDLRKLSMSDFGDVEQGR
jgi:hypothetical protein